MKKYVVMIIAVIFVMAAIVLIFRPEVNPTHLISASQNKNTQTESNQPAIFSAASNSAQSVNHQGNDLMQAIEPNAVRQLIIPAHFKEISSGFLFSFDQDEMSYKQVDDKFAIKMLQFDIHRTAKINQIEVLEDDITRWQGSFEGYPEDINHFTVTQSLKDRYTILKVLTDKGSYIAEIKDGIGLARPEVQLTHDELHAEH